MLFSVFLQVSVLIPVLRNKEIEETCGLLFYCLSFFLINTFAHKKAEQELLMSN